MDHCLTITEILSIIFENFYDTRQPKELAVLARTCQAFTEPALNVLWREQLSLGPLIQCMPQDLWTLVARSEGDEPYEPEPYLIFRRCLKTGDWDRFDFYASRIRQFGTSQFSIGGIDVDKGVFSTFRRYRPTRTPLLPNLRHVRLDLRSDPSLQLLLGPTLTSIHIVALDKNASKFNHLNSSIIQLSPNLQDVEFNLLTIPLDDSKSPIFPLICGLPQLRIVSLPSLRLPPAVAAHLSSLSLLTTLRTIRIPISDVDFFVTARFSALREFSMRPDTWSSATAILDSMPCTFKSLSAYCHSILGDEPVSVLRTFLEKLCLSFGSLSAIDLLGSRIVVDDPNIHASHVIRPLFSCRMLQAVTLMFGLVEVLDDTWLLNAAAAWPLLETLKLGTTIYPKTPNPKMTFTGLVSLIKACPRLHDIRLILDITTLKPALLDGVSTAHLSNLGLDHIVPPNRADFLQLFRSMFPTMPYFISAPGSTNLQRQLGTSSVG